MDQQHEAPVASSLPLQRSHHQRATAYPAMRLSKREMDENAQAKQEANEEWHGSALAARRRAGAGDGLTGGLTRLRFTSTTGRDGSTDASLTSPTLSSPSSQEVGDQNRKVFVGGIASHVTLAAVQEYFSQFGKVEHVMLMFDKSTQRHRGFGFVTFENEAVVDRVCNMHLHNIGGKMVECKRAQPKDDLVPVTLQRRPPNTPTGSALASAAALSAAASTMPFYGLGSLTGGGADAAGLGLGGRGGGAPFGGLPTAPTTEQMLAAYAAAASQFLPYSGASGGGGAASLYSQAGLLGGGGGGGMLPSPGYHAGLLSPSMTAAAAALAASGLYHLPGMGGGVPEAAYNPPATPSPINYQQALALEALYGLQNGAPPQSYFPYEF